SANGVSLWSYPYGTIADWNNTLDITGIETWPLLHNSETTWGLGAFDQNIDPENEFDFGWGIYDFITHAVEGDSLFVIQLADESYRKLKIAELTVGGEYHFTYADLDGNNEQTVIVDKSEFAGKNFAYYSIAEEEIVDREPLSASWDLLFTQYTAFVPTPYVVAGVLHNEGVLVAQADGVDVETEEDYNSFAFVPEINTIGYDWKSFNGTGFDIVADQCFFVQQTDGEIWKVVFTGFGGSANGNYEFTKEKLLANNIAEMHGISLLEIYPNPAKESCSLVLNAVNAETIVIRITDIHGKVISTEQRNLVTGMNLIPVDVARLTSGLYQVTIESATSIATKRLMVN
ncbi:MAG: T9SS type A sorting domain-containing protein, partial [Flavobacteriales bacterium]|nr:T9SS type A sorting domain-containing protein [Flavobacteriales bacterium]